jgi:hypothetical protein
MTTNLVTESDALKLCARMSEGIARYELHQNEQRLALWVICETFCQRRLIAPIDFERVTKVLSGRPERWFGVLTTLQKLGVVLFNATEGVIEPNPDFLSWSRARALRAESLGSEDQGKLELKAERPLDAALASNGRDAALSACNESAIKHASNFDVKEHLRLWRENPDAFTQDSPPPTVGVGISLAKASSSKSLAKLKSAVVGAPVEPGTCFEKIRAVDKAGALRNAGFAKQWSSWCDQNDRAVEKTLVRFHSANASSSIPIANPLAWMSRILRDELRK